MKLDNQLTFESMTEEQLKNETVHYKVAQEMVELGGRICKLMGLPRSTGQIFGLLYLCTEPLSLNQMSSILGISKGSASMGTRQLVSWHVIRKIWIPGDRRDYYEIIEDMEHIIQVSYNSFIKPKIDYSKDRLATIEYKLEEDIKTGVIPLEKKEILKKRINTLSKIHKRVFKFLPLIEKMIG